MNVSYLIELPGLAKTTPISNDDICRTRVCFPVRVRITISRTIEPREQHRKQEHIHHHRNSATKNVADDFGVYGRFSGVCGHIHQYTYGVLGMVGLGIGVNLLVSNSTPIPDDDVCRMLFVWYVERFP